MEEVVCCIAFLKKELDVQPIHDCNCREKYVARTGTVFEIKERPLPTYPPRQNKRFFYRNRAEWISTEAETWGSGSSVQQWKGYWKFSEKAPEEREATLVENNVTFKALNCQSVVVLHL